MRAFSIVPEYLTSAELGATRNLMDYGVSLGRRFRALKLWFVLRYFGRQGIIEQLRAHVEMARAFEGWVREAEGWEVMAPVHLATVAYRFAPSGGDVAAHDAANHRIMERVNASGEAFLTHTALNGRIALRLSVGNVKTTPQHLARTWELLQAAARSEGAVD